jgi:hypothetical protein
MITSQDFNNIQQEVVSAINETLNFIRDNHFSNYILYLADGEFRVEHVDNQQFSPWLIDYRVDWHLDTTRYNFLVTFLQQHYTFEDGSSVDNDKYRIQMEMMIYMHIWESKSYLKRLKRLSQLANAGNYLWSVDVPDMGKHDFIRNEIRNQFRDADNNLSDIISKGFHTSIRNAFAHSEYTIEQLGQANDINFLNYGGAPWELQGLNFDTWSKRYSYSVLLSYHILKSFHDRRTNLIADCGTDTFSIDHPQRDGPSQAVNIKYHPLPQDSFNFVQI